MNTIRRYAADDAHVIYGTAYDEPGRPAARDRDRHRPVVAGRRAQRRSSVVHSAAAQRTTGPTTSRMTQQPQRRRRGPARRRRRTTPDYTSPSVWRTAAAQAAKVDALASNGMDEFDPGVPAQAGGLSERRPGAGRAALRPPRSRVHRNRRCCANAP